MAFVEAGMGGSQGGYHRIRIQVDLLGQEIGNNRSLCRFTAWFERVNSTSYCFNYNTTAGRVVRPGSDRQALIGGYYSDNAGERWYLALNEDHWVDHDVNGNANPYYYADYNAANGPYLTTGATAMHVGLPQINRYAAITSLSANTVTDISFRIRTTTDVTCNFLQISLEDGVGWRDVYGGNFTDYTHDVGPAGLLGVQLPSGRTYNFRSRVRRADSGLWSESGVVSVTTLGQGGHFDTMGL